jgi:hypothetical protein
MAASSATGVDMSTQDEKLDFASDFSSDFASGELGSLSDNQLEAACGGLKWIDIHMPYNDFNRWKINDPSPTRLC